MSSSYSDSDFRALGHVGNSRGSSDVNLYDIIYHKGRSARNSSV